ncbi:MAG: hypothetical protein WC551_10525 [Patescibacteria group bacterium]
MDDESAARIQADCYPTVKDEVVRIQAEVAPVVKQAGELIVSTADEYQFAAEFLKSVKVAQKKVTDFFGPIKDAAHKAWKKTVAGENELLDPLKNAATTIDGKMTAYRQAQERIRQEAERLAREAQQKEADRLAKLQREAEARAAKAAAEGNAKALAAASRKAEEFAAKQEIVFAAPVSVASTVPAIKGLSTAKRWYAKVVKAAAIPVGDEVTEEKKTITVKGMAKEVIIYRRGFWVLDESLLDSTAGSTRGTFKVPGVEFHQSETNVTRTK